MSNEILKINSNGQWELLVKGKLIKPARGSGFNIPKNLNTMYDSKEPDSAYYQYPDAGSTPRQDQAVVGTEVGPEIPWHEHQHKIMHHVASKLNIIDSAGKELPKKHDYHHLDRAAALGHHVIQTAGIDPKHLENMEQFFERNSMGMGGHDETLANMVGFLNMGKEARDKLSYGNIPKDVLHRQIRDAYALANKRMRALKEGDTISIPWEYEDY